MAQLAWFVALLSSLASYTGPAEIQLSILTGRLLEGVLELRSVSAIFRSNAKSDID